MKNKTGDEHRTHYFCPLHFSWFIARVPLDFYCCGCNQHKGCDFNAVEPTEAQIQRYKNGKRRKKILKQKGGEVL